MSISKEERPRVCPVGTIRSWQRGMVIKLHEATNYHNGWYDLPSFPILEKLGNHLNKLSQEFCRIKEPVNGEVFLDEIITNFKKVEGEQNGPFKPTDFKQYEGFYGALKYSFTNEFTKRAMSIWQQMYIEIQDRLAAVGAVDGKDDIVKAIKKEVREKYKDKLSKEVDISLFTNLGDVIQANYEHLLEAKNLSPELEEKYKQFRGELADLRNSKADKYFEVVDKVNELKQFCVENFSSNWILYQTQTDSIDKDFEFYLNHNNDAIKTYLEKESIKRFDVDIFSDAHIFYGDLVKKLEKTVVEDNVPTNEELTNDYDVEINNVKGVLSVVADTQKSNYDYDGVALTVTGSNQIMKELMKYLGTRDSLIVDANETSGISSLALTAVATNSLSRFFVKNTVDNDLHVQRFASLLSIIGKHPKPTAATNSAFKRFSLTGKKLLTFFQGQNIEVTLGFGDNGSVSVPRYNVPTISLANIKDAEKIKGNFLKKFKQVGFSEEEAKNHFQSYVNANKFPVNKYDLDIIFTDLINKDYFEKAKLDFKPVLQMRFNSKYKKQLTGDWNKSNINALETIEKLIDTLPKGHIVNNSNLTTIQYDNEYTKTYAFYDPNNKKIQFSPDCLRATSKVSNIDATDHFASVVVHEMGHAVSKKLDRYGSQEYRKFANQCGWSYKEERTKDNATGDDIRIPRNGSNSGIKLITDYAHVSPEEAFAEYYSFYHLNKKSIDSYLDTGDSDIIKTHSQKFVTKQSALEYQNTKLDEMNGTHSLLKDSQKIYDLVHKDFIRNNFKDELDLKVLSVSPWAVKFEKPYAPDETRNLLRSYRSSDVGSPAFLVDNGNGTYQSIENKPAYNQDNILEANRFAQRNQPAVVISKRSYDKLIENYPGDVICTMMAHNFKDSKMPKAQKIEKVETEVSGLFYDRNIISHNIISSNKDILSQMRKLYESDELKKAIDELFGEDEKVGESSGFAAISKFFKPFTDAIGNIIKLNKFKKEKPQYADLIVVTNDLRVLLVKRSKDDDFMPGKLALPGGKIELNETPICAAIRETLEEINIVFNEEDVRFAKVIENTDKTKSFYFYILLNENFVIEDHIVLDHEEQHDYQLVSINNLNEIPSEFFILDLKERLTGIIEEKFDEIISPKQLITVTPEISLNGSLQAISFVMYNMDRNDDNDDLFIQTLIDNKDTICEVMEKGNIDDEFEKGKKAFPIGSLDKAKKNVKTAAGWVPIVGNEHHVHSDYKHLISKEEKQIEEVKELEKETADVNTPSTASDGSLNIEGEISIKPKQTPSPQQQGIFDFIQSGEGNCAVDAKAGTGKTTTIVNSMEFIPKNKKIAFVAFSKLIQTELSERLPKEVDCSTLHAFGFNCIKKVYGKYIKVEKDKKKLVLNEFVNRIATEQKLEDGDKIEFMANVYKLVSTGQQNLTADPALLTELVRRQGVELISNEAQYVRTCMKMLDARTEMIDYEDMIYLPAAYDKFGVQKYDFVFVDECQDLNKAQLKLVRKMFDPKIGGRMVAVGDPRQAIFGFMGSDHESFENIANTENTKRLPLSVSYRCGKSIINYVRQTTGVDIDYWEKAEDGEVNLESSINDIKAGDMVLCRNNAPLISLCMKFIGEKKAATIKGRDIGETMINEIQRYVGKKLMDSPEGFKNMYLKINLEIGKIINKQVLRGLTHEQALESNPVINLTERRECYEALRDDSKTPNEMVANISKIFSESQKGGIQLSSVHKAKGLEADRVYIVEDDMLHGTRAKNEFQATQEANLRYVAYTRAKKSLNLVTDWYFYNKLKKSAGNETTYFNYIPDELNKANDFFGIEYNEYDVLNEFEKALTVEAVKKVSSKGVPYTQRYHKKIEEDDDFEYRKNELKNSTIYAGLKDKLIYSVKKDGVYYDKRTAKRIDIPEKYADVIESVFHANTLNGFSELYGTKTLPTDIDFLSKIESKDKVYNKGLEKLKTKHEKLHTFENRERNVNQFISSINESSTKKFISDTLTTVSNMFTNSKDIKISFKYNDKQYTLPLLDLIERNKSVTAVNVPQIKDLQISDYDNVKTGIIIPKFKVPESGKVYEAGEK